MIYLRLTLLLLTLTGTATYADWRYRGMCGIYTDVDNNQCEVYFGHTDYKIEAYASYPWAELYTFSLWYGGGSPCAVGRWSNTNQACLVGDMATDQTTTYTYTPQRFGP